MQKIKNIVLIGGGVILIVLGIAGYLIYGQVSTSSQHRSGRDRAKSQLRQFYDRNPFPSKANLDIEKENAENLQANWASVLESVQRVAFPTNETSFNSRREQMISDLREADPKPHGERVVVADFGFGFDKYRDGAQPTGAETIKRLIEQTYVIEHLVMEIYASGVQRLTRVERDVFEEPRTATGSAAPVRPPLGVIDVTAPNSPVPVSREVVKFELEADEASLIALLNRLAAMPLFTVVTRVEVTKSRPDYILPSSAPVVAASGVVNPRPPRRLSRLVSGYRREAPSKVSIDVEVYRFN